MHVPYSMDDSEPDLYGGLGYSEPEDDYSSPSAVFDKKRMLKYTQEQMDAVIRKHLEYVDQLRNEMLESYDEGFGHGYSQASGECYCG